MIRRACKKVLRKLGMRSLVRWMMLRSASTYARVLKAVTDGNEAFAPFERHGFVLLRQHYYLPIPDRTDLADRLLHENSKLVGVDLRIDDGMKFTEQDIAAILPEFRQRFGLHDTGVVSQFHLINGGFMAGDAHAYYAMIRRRRPKRIIEIGGGNSTKLAAAACEANRADGHATELTVIEPYPADYLVKGFPGLARLIPKRLQDIDDAMFESLESGDILFIDSSHVLKPGGDVQREYCEILPRLRPGVIVHIHDISLPKPYFTTYFDQHLYWQEQSVLQTFLCFNPRFEVIWPGTALMVHHPERMTAVLPEIADMRKVWPLAEPSSFWMRVAG